MTIIIFERSSQKGGRPGGSKRGSTGAGVSKRGQQGTHLEILLSA